MAKLLMILGALLLSIGALLYVYPNALKWLGHLPGDIRIERENGVFYFPITTMILISIIVSLVMRWLRF